jgi:hypothetical protein
LIYFSTNLGATWAVGDAPQNNWQSLACSSDGSQLLAAGSSLSDPNHSQLYLSTTFGVTWASLSAPSNHWFSVASSRDGAGLIAVATTGEIYSSADSGRTWASNNAPVQAWMGVSCSADGTRILAVAGGESAGPIYSSADSGRTWQPMGTLAGHWTSAALSATGNKVAAVEGGYQPGMIYTWQTPAPAPVLTIACLGGDVLISWPGTPSGFVLEQNSSFGLTNWSSVTNVVSVVSDRNQVRVRQGGPHCAFRLRGQ